MNVWWCNVICIRFSYCDVHTWSGRARQWHSVFDAHCIVWLGLITIHFPITILPLSLPVWYTTSHNMLTLHVAMKPDSSCLAVAACPQLGKKLTFRGDIELTLVHIVE